MWERIPAAGKDCVDLEIRIFPSDEHAAGYPVEITLGGQQEFPRGLLAADVLPWVSSGDLATDGQRLFDTLFADSALHGAWAEARGQASRRRVRLRIAPAAAELHALPWELLQEGLGQKRVVLSAQADTPFSRYLPIALPWSGAVEERPIRVLVAIANPADLEAKYNLAQLDVDLERETLAAALGELDPNELEVDFLDPPVTLERLEEMLREGYHVLHYLGHGAFSQRRKQAVLYLQDDGGNTHVVADDALIGMLVRQQVRPKLVFLAACQSAARATADAFAGLGPKLVTAGVPAVVAMQDLVATETARKLSAVFYRRLTEHGAVDLALNEARSTLLTAGRPDAAVPVLFMRLKSGQLWGAEADARGEVLGASNPRVFWSGLLRNIQEGKCTPVIGPRVHGRWLPIPAEIAQLWAEEHVYPFADKDDLPRVARYLAGSQGEDFPRDELLYTLMDQFAACLPQGLHPPEEYDTLTDLVTAVGWQDLTAEDPNDVHRVLAGLNLPLYLTTNPDSFMVEALRAAGREVVRSICPWNEPLDGVPLLCEDEPDYKPTPEKPLVYHCLGNDERVDSLVVTQDHYLDFLVRVAAEPERIPDYIWSALTHSSLLFVGYSLDDWEFHVVMRGLVATRERRRRLKHVGVQLEVVEGMSEQDTVAVQTFLQQYFQEADINIFWGTPAQFTAELCEHLETASAQGSRRSRARQRR